MGVLFVKYTLLCFYFPVVLLLFLKSFCCFCSGKGREKGKASSFSWLTDSGLGVCFLPVEEPFIRVTRATGHFLCRKVEISDQGVRAIGCKQGVISREGGFMRIRKRHPLCMDEDIR